MTSPEDYLVRQIIQSYKGYADTLSEEKRKQFNQLFNFLYEFVEAINAKGEPFPEEAVLVTLVLKQHLLIEDLKEEVALSAAKNHQVVSLCNLSYSGLVQQRQ